MPETVEREYVTDSWEESPQREFNCIKSAVEAEEWRAVVGFPDYEASTLGRFRNGKSGDSISVRVRMASGRPVIGLTNAAGNATTVSPACLMLETFVSPRPDLGNKLLAGFKDGDATNLRPSNLFWTTFKEVFGKAPQKPRADPMPKPCVSQPEPEPEEWRTVARCPDYEVSNLGRFRNKTTGKLRKLSFGVGRLYLSLRHRNSAYSETVSAASVVLETFVSPPPESRFRFMPGFRNGDPLNVRLDNLFWYETDKVRPEYARDDFGLVEPWRCAKPEFVGDNIGQRKLTTADAFNIKRALALGCPSKVLAEQYGISVQNVRLFDVRLWKYNPLTD